MKHKKEDIADWIERTLEEGRGLTDWEQHFVESIADQFQTRGSLSERQEEILERIYTEKVP